MSSHSSFVVSDSARAISMALADSNGTAIDLTSASVTLRFRAPDGSVTERAASIATPATGGIVSYTFSADDLASDGIYLGEWVITFSGDTQLTVPTASPFVFSVRARL